MTVLLWISVVYIVVGIVYTVWCFTRIRSMQLLLLIKPPNVSFARIAMFNILMWMPVLVAVVIDIIRSKK